MFPSDADLSRRTNAERTAQIERDLRQHGFENILVSIAGKENHWVTVEGEKRGGRK